MKLHVADVLVTLVEESSDDLLRMSYHNTQCWTRSVLYKAVEQVMLDLLHNDVIGETLQSHIAKFFDTDAAANLLSKKLFT